MNFSSKLLQDAVDEISRLPGIGKNTATRLALNLIKEKDENENKLNKPIIKKIGRNDPCPCGSGKKYKQCHG